MTANQIAYWNYVENSRHNKEQERENYRSNRARESENYRANIASESLRSKELDIKQTSNLINDAHYTRSDAEANRHNLAMERYYLTGNALREAEIGLGYANLSNSRYISELQNSLGYANLSETSRSHKEQEATANRNVSVGRVNAAANTLNAKTRSRAQDLSEAQWNDSYVSGIRKYNYQQARLNTQKTQTEIDYNKVSTLKLGVDAGVNVLNSLGNLMGNASRMITSVGRTIQ